MAPISFARGAPSPECLDAELLSDCARVALERDGRTILAYGTGGGYGPLRELLGERHGVDPGRVFLTTGGLQGFVFYVAAQLARRPGRVLVEGPTYDRPLKLLGWQGVEVVPLPMDEEGLDPDALEAELARGGDVSFLYTIPTFQNPSGRTLGEERRRRIAELCRAHDLDVLEDDPYGLVRYEGDGARVAPRARGRRARDVHVLVLEDGRPGPARRLVRRARGDARRLRRPRGLDVHLAAAPPAGDRARALRPRRLRAEPRPDPRDPRRPARRDARGARGRASPGARRGAVPRAGTSSGSTSTASRAPTCSSARPRPA